MSVVKFGFVGALCAVMGVSGCSVAEVRGKAPVSPDQCEENWLQEIGAVKPEEVESAANPDGFVASFLVRFAIAFTEPAVANRRYRACLRSVGITDVNAYLSTDSDVTQRLGVYVQPPLYLEAPSRPAHCPRGAGVLYGGSGYCIGR